MDYHYYETDDFKCVRSPDYNFNFNKHNGLFQRWGKTYDDDPSWSKFGPEILDIEVTTICNGPDNVPCSFCYKSNTNNGINMDFNTFKTIIDKFPKQLTQIAIGADATCKSNPDLFKMMEYTRSLGIIPNITVANIDDTVADKLSELCGAVAVSRYHNKNWCYDSVKKLTDRGMKQINIHQMLSLETLEQVYETIVDIKTDERLKNLNAIVFLSLKKKGRGKKFNSLSTEQFGDIVKSCLDNDIRFGFDSCSANKFMQTIVNMYGKDSSHYKKFLQMCEPCESTAFSSYISTEGYFYPCSFTEDVYDPIDVVNCNSFMDDVWNHPQTQQFRSKLLNSCDCNGCRGCPVYEV